MMADAVKRLSHELRLHGVHREAERRAEEALREAMHPLEFLRLILEDEAVYRKERVAKSLVTKARFRTDVCVSDFDMTYDRGLSKARLMELSKLEFVHRKESLLLFGRTGEGKTQLAMALGKRSCENGFRTTFISVNLFFEEIAAAKVAGKFLSFLRTLRQTRVLILDDFGLRNYTHDEATTLLDVLEDRYQKGTVIVTSQVDDQGWPKCFEDPVIAEAIVDRLKHPSQKVILKGGSYRERFERRPVAPKGKGCS